MVKRNASVGLLLSAACLAAAAPAVAQVPRPSAWSSRSLQPMMRVAVMSGQTGPSTAIGDYTRLIARFHPRSANAPGADGSLTDETLRVYDEERRNWLRRYFAGKSVGRLLTLKATLGRPRVSTTTTLASISYASDRRTGESWTSEFDPVRVLTPLFRIDADSAITLEATTSATSSYEISGAAGVLDVVKRATQLVAPTGALITSLNKERFEDASNFVDQTISSLLQESITERGIADFPIKDWAGRHLAMVHAWLPPANEITPHKGSKNSQQLLYLGYWTVEATQPRLSVFADTPLLDTQRVAAQAVVARPAPNRRGRATATAASDAPVPNRCNDAADQDIAPACEAFRNLDPQTVLNFPVDNSVPLGQVVAGDSGIGAARERLIAEGSPEHAAALCALVADRAHILGFNRFDVAAILWAYVSQTIATPKAKNALADEKNCAPLKIAYQVGLPRGGFAGADADVTLKAVQPASPPAIDPVQPSRGAADQPAPATGTPVLPPPGT